MLPLSTTLVALFFLFAQATSQPGVLISTEARADFPLTADPTSREWRNAPLVIAENNPFGQPTSGHRTEIRSRWTKQNLYLLYTCPYETLYLKPNPTTTEETNQLWNWDVAELFIGWDFQNIDLYKEFEISPRGEWVDLDIDHKHPQEGGGIAWNSGFHLKTRLDEQHKIWYGEMQIPWKSISPKPPAVAQQFRVNLYRAQGPTENRVFIAWQPTHSHSFHEPQAFGILKLEGRPR
jgi:hypothetical protein